MLLKKIKKLKEELGVEGTWDKKLHNLHFKEMDIVFILHYQVIGVVDIMLVLK